MGDSLANTIRWDKDEDGIVVLTLDDPNQSANTMNAAYKASMAATVDRLEAEKDDITGVVITLTDQTTTMSGTIRDRAGQPAANTAVIAFPADRTRWTNFGIQSAYIRSSAGSTRGAYTLRGLPAGDYLIVAVDDDLLTRWKDPAFLEAASRIATRMSIAWGDTKTLDLTVQEIR